MTAGERGDQLDELIGETRKIITALSESGHPDKELAGYCEELLKRAAHRQPLEPANHEALRPKAG